MTRKTTIEYRDHKIVGNKAVGYETINEDGEVTHGAFSTIEEAKEHIDHDEDFVDLEQMEAEDGEDYHPGSVVAGSFKVKYRERAIAMTRKPKDVSMKALKRSTSDWLAIELARRTLDEKAVLSVPAFEAILDANGVAHRHWNRTTKGWQGRLRMTGRLALQRIVAEHGELALPDGSAIPAPKNWIAKHTH